MANSPSDDKSQRLSCENRVGSSTTLAVSSFIYMALLSLVLANTRCVNDVAKLRSSNFLYYNTHTHHLYNSVTTFWCVYVCAK